jgi:predicted PurR-regulated permease PerM
MFRKIHSNRNPQDTLFTELRKTFAVYFNRVDLWFRSTCLSYPRQVYSAMVILLVFSIILSFTVFPGKPVVEKPPPLKSISAELPSGFGQITQKALALQESMQLQQQIESLISRDSLSAQDSISLEKMVGRLQQLSLQK